MTVHAFVDESCRANLYLVAVAVTDPAELVSLRRTLRNMLLPGAREIHFRKEKDSRRRGLADAIARLPVEVGIYGCACDSANETARQVCLARLTEDLLARSAHRVVLDSRNAGDGYDRDAFDRETIRRALGKRPSETQLVYEHMQSTQEELLWIADASAWCWGQGGHWRRRIQPIVNGYVQLVASSKPENAKPGRRPSGR